MSGPWLAPPFNRERESAPAPVSSIASSPPGVTRLRSGRPRPASGEPSRTCPVAHRTRRCPTRRRASDHERPTSRTTGLPPLRPGQRPGYRGSGARADHRPSRPGHGAGAPGQLAHPDRRGRRVRVARAQRVGRLAPPHLRAAGLGHPTGMAPTPSWSGSCPRCTCTGSAPTTPPSTPPPRSAGSPTSTQHRLACASGSHCPAPARTATAPPAKRPGPAKNPNPPNPRHRSSTATRSSSRS